MNKKCTCCSKIFTYLPNNTKHNELGAWFNCSCGTTLFVRKVKT
jgi:hypothetical protein